jgi:TPP-dependent pyruvate/acetoin dehydrogenase alpha subunit
MPAERIEDDVLRIYELVSAAVQTLRAAEPGPFFFECMTYRWKEHVGPNDDFHLGYRTREEAEPWFKNDQVKRLAEMIDARQRERIEQEVEAEIQAAFAFAEGSPFPNGAELFTDVFMEAD